MRLDVAAGTRLWIDPGQQREIRLVEFAGSQNLSGGTKGPFDLPPQVPEEGFSAASIGTQAEGGFTKYRMSREWYAKFFGPTTGDLVRLGDTQLWIKVEKDWAVYGDEIRFGDGKVVRDGMGQATGRLREDCLDTVITNALIVDSTGIYKVGFP